MGLLLPGVGCTSKGPSGPVLRVLTYSSLGSKGGFLESVGSEFQKAEGCTLIIESTLGAAQVLSYLEEPKQREQLDVVMGLDEILFERAKSYLDQGSISRFSLPDRWIDLVKPHLAERPGFIPMDYGALSFIYRKSDFKDGMKVPTRLADLTSPELTKKWIVQDPRASSPGLLFFLFADSIVKTKDLRKQWVTLAPSWETSYKMFLAKDAAMVWSYLSSLAYHASKGELDQYGYVQFQEGLPIQVEGMGIVSKPGDPAKANPCIEKWIHFVLEPGIQARLVAKQFMMPVIQGVTLPKYFDAVPKIKPSSPLDMTPSKVDEFVNHFGKEVSG